MKKHFVIITENSPAGLTFDNVYSFIDFIYKCVYNQDSCTINLNTTNYDE